LSLEKDQLQIFLDFWRYVFYIIFFFFEKNMTKNEIIKWEKAIEVA